MKSQPVQLLLIEDDLDDLCLLHELVTEIQEEHLHQSRFPSCELLHALDLEEAFEVLDHSSVDTILFDVESQRGNAVESMCQLRARRPEIPIIVLAGGECTVNDETQMIRLGAQDVLRKSELDCIPLLRAACFAMERNKTESALRSITYMDELTGLYNRTGFIEVAHHELALARKLGVGCALAAVAPAAPANDDIDLLLIEIADLLRSSADAGHILARCDRETFLALLPLASSAGAERFVEHLHTRAGELNRRQRAVRPRLALNCAAEYAAAPPPLEQWIEATLKSLCENGRRVADARCH